MEKVQPLSGFIYALNRYTVIREMTAGKGFADVVFIPLHKGDPAMIVELKRNGTAQSALDQIREKQHIGVRYQCYVKGADPQAEKSGTGRVWR